MNIRYLYQLTICCLGLFSLQPLSLAHACPDRGGLVDVNCDGQVRILTFGDSITAGVGDEQRIGGWPTRTGFLLPGVVITNVGISGERTNQGRARSGMVFSQHPNVDYVVLLEGVNDYWLNTSASTTKNNLLTIINRAQNTGAVVLLANLTHVRRSYQVSWVNAVNAQINPIKQVDFYSLGPNILSGDNLHPNANGYQVMANFIVPLLQSTSEANRPADTDGDGIYDFAEIRLGTDPEEEDSDGDTISDGDEVFTYNTNPLEKDSDGDGFDDDYELFELGSDPNNQFPGAPQISDIEFLAE